MKNKDDNFRLPKGLKILFVFFNFIIFPIIIFLLAFNANSFHGVLDIHESGQYLACVNGIFHGKIPYRDFIPPVGPLFIWILSAALSIFGKTIYVSWQYFLITTISVYIILYLFGRSLFRFRFFSYILPTVALVETFNPFWSSRWAGYSRFGVGLLGIFLQVLYIKKRNPLYLFFVGLVAAFGLLYSIDAGIFLMICAALMFFLMAIYEPANNLKENIITTLKRGVIFGSGLLLVLIPYIIYMVFNKAILSYGESMSLIFSHHVGAWQVPFPDFWGTLKFKYNNNLWLFFISDEFRVYMPRIFYFLVMVYFIFTAFRKNRNITDCVIVPLIAIYGIFGYKSGCRVITGPQFDVSLMPLFLLLIYFLEKAFIFFFLKMPYLIKKEKSKAAIVYGIIAFFTIVISLSYIIGSQKRVYGSWANWIRYQRNKENIMPVYTSLINKNMIKLSKINIDRVGQILVEDDTAKEIEVVTKYIIEKTASDEPIFTFPEHALYYFLADRPAVSRFYTAIYSYTADEWRKELLSNLKTNLPGFIIYSKKLSNVAKNIGATKELLPEVIDFINENYHIEMKMGETGVYKRNFDKL